MATQGLEPSPVGRYYPLSQTLCQLALSGTIASEDVNPETLPEESFARQHQVRSFLGVPVMVFGEAIGVLSVIDRSPRRWAPDDIEALGELALVLGREVETREHGRMLEDLSLSHTRSERRFKAIFHQSPLSLQLFNRDGRTLLVNPAYQRLWNISEEFIEQHIYGEYNILTDPLLEKQGVLPLVRRGFAGEVVTVPEFPYDPSELGRPGRLRWARGLVYPLKDQAGEVREVVLIHTDVTDQVEAERNQSFLNDVTATLLSTLDLGQLLEKMARISIPFLADGCMIDVIEGDHIVRHVTTHVDPQVELRMRRMQEMYPPQQGSPQPTARVIASGAAELLPVVDSAVIAEHTFNPEHAELIKSIGINSHLAIPLELRGKIIGVLNLLNTTQRPSFNPRDLQLAQDLGRRAAIAIDNARLYRDAREAIEQREEFISVASHELKTPLTSVKLQMDLANLLVKRSVDGKIEPEFITRMTEICKRQLDRLGRLVDDMLDVSRISSGKLAIVQKDTDLSEVTHDVLERFQEEFTAQGVELRILALEPVLVHCDPLRMDQVITNLLSNALRYGQGRPVELSLTHRDNMASLSVRDYGVGIGRSDQDRIFERFERVTAPHIISGLGLGLYITRQIVEQHQGEIRVDSSPGHGATFTVSIPAKSSI